ncbi:50S ribosomal protein L24e [Candidatus Woesearchaeota archaeon]|nr:MAG: 50S ribosomal protein L24e [Candidatus Woesearchaeota archaeon]
MALCSFCGVRIPAGTGKLFVKNDGKLLHFCSLKCEKNLLKLRRKPRNVAWTKAARKEKEASK